MIIALHLLAHLFVHALMDVGLGCFFFFALNRIFKALSWHSEYKFFLSYLRSGSMLEEHKSFMDEYFKFKLKQKQLLEFYRGCDHCPNTMCPQREKWEKLKRTMK